MSNSVQGIADQIVSHFGGVYSLTENRRIRAEVDYKIEEELGHRSRAHLRQIILSVEGWDSAPDLSDSTSYELLRQLAHACIYRELVKIAQEPKTR